MSDFTVQKRTPQNSDYRFSRIKAAPSASIHSHAHDALHILFMHKGDFDEAHGEHSSGLKRNGVRISDANTDHSINFGKEGAEFTVLHINGATFAGNLGAGAMNESLFLYDDDVATLASNAFENTAVIGTQLRAELDLKRCLARLRLLVDGKNPSAIPDWLHDANHVFSDPCAAMSVEETAQSFRISREHLTRSFKKYFGCTPQEVITFNALNNAIELLQTTDASCAEIAVEAGFYDQSHLTGKMAEKLGVTPHRLRQMTPA